MKLKLRMPLANLSTKNSVRNKDQDTSKKRNVSVWSDCYPVSTSILIPSNHAKEITEKLKKNNDITNISNFTTAKGAEINRTLKLLR